VNASIRTDDVNNEAHALDLLVLRLVNDGALTYEQAQSAQSLAQLRKMPVADILVARHGVAQRVVIAIQAEFAGCGIIDPRIDAPDPRLVAEFGLERSMAQRLLPWRRNGDEVVVLACQPEAFDENLNALIATFGPVRMALTTQTQYDQAIADNFGLTLAQAAENATPTALSCRNWKPQLAMCLGLGTALALLDCKPLITRPNSWMSAWFLKPAIKRPATPLGRRSFRHGCGQSLYRMGS